MQVWLGAEHGHLSDHNYTGRNYIGHHYIGHNYLGRKRMGLDSVDHNPMGRKKIGHIVYVWSGQCRHGFRYEHTGLYILMA